MTAQHPSFVFEVIPDLNLLLTYQGRHSPSDDEWDSFVKAIEELSRAPTLYRYLTLSEGGHPTSTQQARIKSVANGRTPAVSIISTSVAMRFVVSVLALINPRIQCFRPDQKMQAYSHIGLKPQDVAIVERRIEVLRSKLPSARAA